MITGSAIAAVISDPNLPDTPIIACNQAFIDLTGYAEDEILGRNCRFLRGADTEETATEELRAAVRERRATLVEILNYKKDGTPFRNAVMLAPIFGDDGRLRYMLGSQIEVGTPPDHDAAARFANLTPRQRDVLNGVMRGLLNKQIAYELGISERTVKLHRAEMLQALGCRTVAEAIRLAVEQGL
ncbi:LuxR C-terminal-related transcriptional regulator [Sphingomonas hankookensis]|jgi:PAS domain S-box-containing protein|nr:LuxR C-terminal-related transcriptional regulator [Sphingomonas hankookensis]PZT91544.1 MAG: PAS domain-containing protein [Sphingomonas sp.]RSV24483.1 PAS domain-containing protein [Sphingomonas sp. ABOLH]